MVKIEKDYVFDGPDGKTSLKALFDGRRQLIGRRGRRLFTQHTAISRIDSVAADSEVALSLRGYGAPVL